MLRKMLESPFLLLPLSFDARQLQKEVAQLEAWEWRPDRFGKPGYWTINLISHRGADNERQEPPFAPTPHLDRCPYLRQVLASFRTPLAEVRLRRLDREQMLPVHTENAHCLWLNRVRVHVPVMTHPEVQFWCGGQRVHMGEGQAWAFDRLRMHRVVNPSSRGRIHLIIDTSGSAGFWDLLKHSYQPFGQGKPSRVRARRVAFRPRWMPQLATERTALRPIASAEELDHFLALFFNDMFPVRRPVGPAVEVKSAISSFAREWRATWNLHGEDPEAWNRYRHLGERYHAILLSLESRFPELADMEAAPSFRLRSILETFAFNLNHADETTLERLNPSDTLLSLNGNLLVKVSPRGALDLRIPHSGELVPVSFAEIRILTRFVDPARARHHHPMERAVARRFLALGLLRKVPRRAFIEFGGVSKVESASTAEALPRRLDAPTWLRFPYHGAFGLWDPAAQAYLTVSMKGVSNWIISRLNHRPSKAASA